MKETRVILMLTSVFLLFVLAYMSMELIKEGKKAKIYKADYAELHSVKYGMFNSDIWTNKITKTIEDKIDNFDININNRDEVEGYVSTVIETLIVETERIVKEKNKVGDSFLDNIMGSTKQIITDSIIDFTELQKRVPEFTAAVMEEIEKPENQARAKKVLISKIKAFMKDKFKLSTDMTELNSVLHKYKTLTVSECTLILDKQMTENTRQMNNAMYIILLLAIAIIILVILQGTLNSLGLFTLVGTTLSLLTSGILLPMLDIEAKIIKLYFVILEQPVIFENQILFFQSKSIADLLQLLIDSGEAKMIFVGILLVMFSVVFPLLKVIATTVYHYSRSAIGNHVITRFFALYSTKWSMADVMVVSIFMAYLGLDGVIDSELNKLEFPDAPVNIISSNGTHLEVGFFLFLGFVLTSFVLSILVEKARKSLPKKQEDESENKNELSEPQSDIVEALKD